MQKSNAYDRVTQRILELLENGVCPWRQPWSSSILPPQNYVSGRQYHGINFFTLGHSGFTSPYFMTFRQAQERGGHVKKGSKGFPVVYWGLQNKSDDTTPENASKDDNESKKKERPFLKSYTVFNSDQIDGINFPSPEKEEPQLEFNPIEKAEEICTNWDDSPEVKHGFARAYYKSSEDKIYLPNKEDFTSPEEYYATLQDQMNV